MNDGSAGRERSSSEDLRRRLAAYSRYAELVRGQIRAVQEENLERFNELAEARERVQDELGASPPEPPSPHSLDPEGRALLEKMTAELREALAGDRELRALLSRERSLVASQLRAMSERGGNARRYLTGEAPSALGRPARLNVRL